MGESVKPHDREILMAYIGNPRLSPYMREAKDELELALRLYEWNADLTAALWLPLCHLEVGIRNAFSVGLQVMHYEKGGPGSWVEDPGAILRQNEIAEIDAAKYRIVSKGKSATVGQVVSELNFSFWRYLTGKPYKATLWPYLARAFNHAPDRLPSTIAKPLVRLHRVRNRIAHHEPVWNHEPMASYQDIRTLAGYMSPVFCDWIEGLSEIDAVWRQDPRR